MTTTLRIDDDLKKECDIVLNDIGLSFSGAITIFMREITRTGEFPFRLRSSYARTFRNSSSQRVRGDANPSIEASDELTLEVNAEIAAARRGCRARRAIESIRAAREAANEKEWTLDEINAEIAAARKERSSL